MKLEIRDPESNLIFNNMDENFFNKMAEITGKSPLEEYTFFKTSLEKKLTLDGNIKYAVIGDNIECIYAHAMIINYNVKYFNNFKDAEEQYMDNCFEMGINPFTAAAKLYELQGDSIIPDELKNEKIIWKG